ncbi:probable Rho GTPase-activating protein CG5521 isoform X3 [Venturia canescens]|uniref:probable Rho GTPase-activating protein CG5521 isoform X3 n=1 Tax=Venturia canescens TaxID=32260 RepID=UPI001C9C6F95|nr:probable Rho GTPase-activating protein CG5521 isoform X3 [Venturia canescens]
MFSKKLHVDVKKSTLKIQDVKKDSATRFKHLKIVLENVDIDEAKGFFEGNFSHVYFILYDCFVTAEANLRQRELSFHLVHKAHREELEQVLQLLEKVLTLLPELLNRRWQCHSLARILDKLLHPGNSWKLRRQALRYFILWYQALGENAPDHIHRMFASLVPGFPPRQASPYHSTDRKLDSRKERSTNLANIEEREKREFYDTQLGQSIFHDGGNNSCQGPISRANGLPILPAQSGEKPLDNETLRFFEALLEFMVTQVVKVEWRDKHTRQYRSFQFLLERFKTTYLRYICPEFDENFSLYKPNLDLPTMRHTSNQSQGNYVLCKVALIKWLASFTHVTRKDGPFTAPIQHNPTPSEDNAEQDMRRVSVGQQSNTSTGEPNSLTNDSTGTNQQAHQQQDQNLQQDDGGQSAVALVRQVLYGSRDNVNFVHEIYRQAFLLDLTHAGAIRKAIAVYKDWIQMNEIPPFMLEPLEGHKERCENELEQRKEGSDNDKSPSDSYSRQTRLRNDSYLGAIHRENLFVRAGLQNVLQVFITQASNVFFLETPGGHASATLLEEQTDSCKRVLNVYRYVVMHARLEPATWDQLLRVLLQITSLVLGGKTSKRKHQETIGGKLAPAIFQTLIVTWIKANLNVVIFTQLWDQFLQVLTSLTQWEELIREWAKTLDTLTRVLARHVYNLDLNDLPLDRLSEQKSKKRRGVGSRAASAGSVQSPRRGSVDRETTVPGKENVPDHPLLRDSRKIRQLPRSVSDNNIYTGRLRAKYHRNRTNPANFGIPVLPLSIERDMAKLLSDSTSGASVSTAEPSLIGRRRAKSLDSLVVGDSEPPTPRCPSPTPSSGVDSNKDSPIQIENIDGSSIDTNDASERRSVMAGGGVRGWLPDVAVVLWRRMLSALGDVNDIQDPVLHGQVMEYLVQLTQTLIKIRLNQGISGDNQVTPPAPELIPPLTVIAPWCFKAIQLPSRYETGRLAAYRLICLLTVQPLDVSLPQAHLTLFYRAVHGGIASNDMKVLEALVKYTGPRLFSLNLPGASLLILDYIHAANIILAGQDLDAPRTEAVSVLGSLLTLPATMAKLPVLQPTNNNDISTMPCPDAKEHIVTILLRSCRREPSGIARCVALSSIAMFAYRELSHDTRHSRIPEAITVLLQALRATQPAVAQVACDGLLLICDKANVLLESYPKVACKIVQVLSETLDTMTNREKRGALTKSMLFCLGEWAMQLGPSVLLDTFQNKTLLLTIFTVLDNIVHNRIGKGGHSQHHDNEDFDPDTSIDDVSAKDSSNKSPRRGNIQSIQLAAKMVMMHLVNHLGHFPMGIGASRLSSLVVELDDVPGINGDELSSAIFQAPNIQLLMLSDSIIMSLVELAALDAPGGGVTAGLTTAPSMVRVLLRDLAGKTSWDSCILYSQPSSAPSSIVDDDDEKNTSVPVDEITNDWKLRKMTKNDESRNTVCPRHTMRHREPNILPTYANAASDMDNLDDLLRYIGHTSPEVISNPEIALNSPASPPQGNCFESETISAILSQRNAAREKVKTLDSDPSAGAMPTIPPSSRPPPAPFHHCRLLFSHLGLSGWEQRRKLHLLAKNEKLLRELRNLDGQRSRETHKMAVIYVSHGQEDKNSILGNVTASKEYESFVARLAWEVELETHTGFLGGLVPGKASGHTAPYYATSFVEILFHVATRMPSDSPESLLQKTRHLGNDEIHIVWSEHWRDYRRDIIPTEFCDVLIVIYPLPDKLYRIRISRKSEIPYFGPLFDECIVEDKVLPGLVRATALAASRAKRSTLTLYQHYYEERARSIDTVMRNHKEATTFEEFAANVYSPVQPPSPFSGASSVSGSTTSMQSAASSNLAAALIDPHQGRAGLRNNSGSSDNRANRERMRLGLRAITSTKVSSAGLSCTRNTMQSIKLSSGYDMPTVGLGTWQAKPEEIEAAVATALEKGYRHIDTAFNYTNEDAIGASLKKWFTEGGKREDLFVTTKLPHYGNRPSDVEKFIKLSLEKLGLDYLDMYLVHMPFAFVQDAESFAPAINEDGSYVLDVDSDPVSVWKEMEKQVRNGLARSIGLSNFNEKQIQEVWDNADIKPSNLQVEMHAYHQQKKLRKFCKEHNIAVTAYSPLASPGAKAHFQSKYNYSPDKFPDLLGHPVVQEIAKKHNKTSAQILLRHLVQEGVIVIPKSSSPERIKINSDLFDFTLTDDDVKALDSLDHGPAGRIFNFLFFKGVEHHRHYPFKEELP